MREARAANTLTHADAPSVSCLINDQRGGRFFSNAPDRQRRRVEKPSSTVLRPWNASQLMELAWVAPWKGCGLGSRSIRAFVAFRSRPRAFRSRPARQEAKKKCQRTSLHSWPIHRGVVRPDPLRVAPLVLLKPTYLPGHATLAPLCLGLLWGSADRSFPSPRADSACRP